MNAASASRLGFRLTPRGIHNLGSQNHCIMFADDYIELLAVPQAAAGAAALCGLPGPKRPTSCRVRLRCPRAYARRAFVVWRPEWQSHGIGATGIAAIALIAEDALVAAQAYGRIFGEKPAVIDEGLLVQTGSAPIALVFG